jgi:hypothetical protein
MKFRDSRHRSSDACTAFAAAIKKYGWDNFKHETLAEGLTQDEANLVEQEMIVKHQTMSPSGYNLRSGGSRGLHSQESKLKISAANLGAKRSEEAKARMSMSKLGKKQVTKRTVSEEGRKRLSAAHSGKKLTTEHKKAISQANKGRDVSQETRSKIASSLKGHSVSEETRRKISETKRKKKEAAQGDLSMLQQVA